MKGHRTRLDRVVEGMGPEEMARWLIESPLFGEEISDAEERHNLRKMSLEEGRRYNAFLDRWRTLQRNLSLLFDMLHEIERLLLIRDRTLWYFRAAQEIEEAILFGPAAETLLRRNKNLKPGEPLEIKGTLVRLTLGVWGRKRSQFGPDRGVSLNPGIEAGLDALMTAVRRDATEAKALARYTIEEGDALPISAAQPAVEAAVARLREYDQPLLDELGNGVEPLLPAGAVFPVERRWAVVWEEIEEDEETARRVREHPKEWQPKSIDRELAGRTWAELWRDLTQP